MKKVSTIIKQLADLEKELDNYSGEQIRQAIEQYEKESGHALSSPVLDVIYDGTELNEELKFIMNNL